MKHVGRLLAGFGRGLRLAWHGPLLIAAALVPDRAALALDIERWTTENHWPARSPRLDLLELVSRQPTFRNLLYFRLAKGGLQARIVLALARRLYPPDGLLFLDGSCTIGGGLYIQHGFSTIVNADLGDRCWINQQVTIGFKDASGRPRLGHNVRVSAGAKVLGPIVVGDNVAIGANAVVVKSVPDDCTVVGVPAYIVRRQGQPVRESL